MDIESAFERYNPEDEGGEEAAEQHEDVIAKLLRTAEKRKKKRLRQLESQTKDEQELANGQEASQEASEADEVDPTETPHNADEQPMEVDSSAFTVIGEAKPIKLKPLAAALPHWISKPTVFDKNMDIAAFPPESLSPDVSDFLISNLKANLIERLFPVQITLVPYMLRQFRLTQSIRPRDICVSSPTGSGKTLAFVLPVLEALKNRVETAIRALIVLPVRDLALQVFEVFKNYARGSTLSVGCSIGHRNFQDDIKELIYCKRNGSYRSKVDILVCTPGKLVDLIQRAPGFNLQELRFLVLDEADRMLSTSELEFNWMQEVEKAIYGRPAANMDLPCLCNYECDPSCHNRISVNCLTPCSLRSYSSSTQSVQKLLFSATLSHDPVKLQSMKLFEPQLFIASALTEKKKLTPLELKEQMIVIPEDRKPLVIWHLVAKQGCRQIICFTGSVENTHRLFILLKRIPNIKVAEFASHMKAKDRDRLVKQFSDEEVNLIVCSDIMARGIDLSNVQYVICYDPPTNETSYIHRIGRTARAGKSGTAITLINPDQMGHFQAVIRKAHNENLSESVEKLKIPKKELDQLLPKYKEALKQLANAVKRESNRKFYRSIIGVNSKKR